VTLWNEGHRLKQYNLFLQDEWKIRRNLSITYGLRWEVNPAPTEAGGRVYVPSSPIIGTQGLVSFVHSDRWFNNNNLGAIGPRVGIAWSPGSSGKTVIRSGWGIAFDFLAQVGVRLGPEVAMQAGLVGWRREVIAFGYQLGSLVLPGVVPVILWASLNRPFIERLPGSGSERYRTVSGAERA
jgi:hypothetical protein